MVNIMTVINKDNKDNKGFLFPNTNKNKPTQPDLSGKAIIDGKEKQFAAWENVTKDGKKYWACVFSDPKPVNEEKTGVNNNSNNHHSNDNSNNSKPAYTSNISDDLDDLDAILRSAEDDDPFK